jgi:hypothetical protein
MDLHIVDFAARLFSCMRHVLDQSGAKPPLDRASAHALLKGRRRLKLDPKTMTFVTPPSVDVTTNSTSFGSRERRGERGGGDDVDDDDGSGRIFKQRNSEQAPLDVAAMLKSLGYAVPNSGSAGSSGKEIKNSKAHTIGSLCVSS